MLLALDRNGGLFHQLFLYVWMGSIGIQPYSRSTSAFRISESCSIGQRLGELKKGEIKRETRRRFRDLLYKTFFIMYTIWIGLLGLKFQKEEQSPFKTQGFFCFLSPVALCVTLLVFWILFYTKKSLKYPDMVRKILMSVGCFSAIIAHLSLVLVFIIPPRSNWIGYSIIIGLFVVMVGYHAMSFCKKISTIWECIKGFKENKTSSRATTSSCV